MILQNKILVVEDSRTQAEQLRHILEQHRYEVAVAANGRIALELLAQFGADLIISDVNMPEMDGYELSRRIKADPSTSDIPVILVTTMSDPQDVIRGLECGADNFVLKPLDKPYLLGRVRYVMANREMRRPDDAAIGVRIFFNGEQHFITADRLQILNLLLSTYEAAIQRNKELSKSKESLERRSTEIALAHRFLDEVIENMPDAIFIKDAFDLSFVRINRGFEELMGISREELIGKSVDDFSPSEEAVRMNAVDRRVLASGKPEAIEEFLRTRHRGKRIVNTRKLVIRDASDQPRFLLGIAQDITEKTEREREILRLNAALEQRTAEADAASRAKGTFLATMSHEIRTPMNGMLGMLELLSLTQLNEEQRNTLEIIRESSASLLRIVDDVLDFSKIEAGQLEIYPEPTSVAQVLKDLQRTYGSAAGAKGLTLTCAVDSDVKPVLLVDALRLRQVLGNFVSNAIKFTDHGSIELLAQVAQTGPALQHLRFLVRDSGIGISPENQRRLFHPFIQGDAAAARRSGGTGLGLSICRSLAEMMDGSVEVDSALGEGTTMSLTLPLMIADSAEQQKVQSNASDSAAPPRPRRAPPVGSAEADRMLVLVIDDHPTNRLLLQRQLKTLGYAAETAEDGDQGLALWESGRFAVVITDCEMPGMSGYELAGRIRDRERSDGRKRTPILACTAHALAGEAEKCIGAGMDECLVKPMDLAALQLKLARWLPLPLEVPLSTANFATVRDAVPVDLSIITATWGEDPVGVQEILEFFRRTNDEDATALCEAVAKADLPASMRAAHRMLGSSKMVGAHDFAAVCERIHRACRKGDWPAALGEMPALELQRARLNAYVAAGAGSPPDGLESQALKSLQKAVTCDYAKLPVTPAESSAEKSERDSGSQRSESGRST